MVPLAAGAASASSVPVVVGEEAHIVAEEDDGPRGDPSTPIHERNAYPNLILMCPTHHRLIDKDHGRHYSVDQLQRMKADHEALVERRRVGSSDDKETRSRRRQELLLETASASRGRLIARWVAAGVGPRLAESLADDDSVGAPGRLGRTLPGTGLAVLEGDFGSGKSVTAERIHQADVATALDNQHAPVPLYLAAKSVNGTFEDAVCSAATSLGDFKHCGVRIVGPRLGNRQPRRAPVDKGPATPRYEAVSGRAPVAAGKGRYAETRVSAWAD